jgi:hypothetical protein
MLTPVVNVLAATGIWPDSNAEYYGNLLEIN